ncbi:uncharacterized protein PGTG_04576 [Puccinia graminis f. sp. tritici CRL 75-36-700-3]|uniref:Uncharacterized protein n=1 Tax=Puccinia graminis f. sp. tritici (strain CRL 75-36-700-3 / race SCCL) TaxID=418459 RepID=E3K2Q1_PUCGT|nr:uncharacterized protein PGTG_04576 [Puccinia graminis f. sp. tritici CRL 75-36-700-3]EFP78620.1 hypothetical protein PGTG_04576 [Puccinia graminis f. sp. tritici CRL 75-36-700-3]
MCNLDTETLQKHFPLTGPKWKSDSGSSFKGEELPQDVVETIKKKVLEGIPRDWNFSHYRSFFKENDVLFHTLEEFSPKKKNTPTKEQRTLKYDATFSQGFKEKMNSMSSSFKFLEELNNIRDYLIKSEVYTWTPKDLKAWSNQEDNNITKEFLGRSVH